MVRWNTLNSLCLWGKSDGKEYPRFNSASLSHYVLALHSTSSQDLPGCRTPHVIWGHRVFSCCLYQLQVMITVHSWRSHLAPCKESRLLANRDDDYWDGIFLFKFFQNEKRSSLYPISSLELYSYYATLICAIHRHLVKPKWLQALSLFFHI